MGKKHREGFTLIELLVLMMVIAIALGLGIPAMSALAANERMSAAANDLVASMHAARSEASARGRSVTLCASSDWNAAQPSCDPGAGLLAGWIVFEDADADGVTDAGEPVLQVHGPVDETILAADGSLADVGPPQYLSFRADGPLQQVGANPPVRNIQLCDGRGDQDTGSGRAAGRWIAISPAGRPALIDRTARLQGPGNPLGGC